MRRAWLIGLAVLFFFGVVLAVALNRGPDPGAIAARCREAEPEWASYHEDIKGLIGAGPVASWNGAPHSAQCNAREVLVDFRIAAPWDRYAAVMPVMLRTPAGRVYLSKKAVARDGERRYVFELAGNTGGGALPWVEIRFPHGQRRLHFSASGTWTAPEEDAGGVH